MTVKQPSSPGRRRLVPCKKHKLHYDPSLHSGCVLCRRENPLGTNRRERPILEWVLVLLVFAVGAWYLINRKPAAGPATVAVATHLDPGPYRAQIQTLDDLLFQGNVVSPGDASRIEIASSALAAQLRRREASRPPDAGEAVNQLAPLAESTARAVEGLASGLRALGREEGVEVEAARAAWVSARDQGFGPQDWYRTTVATGPAAPAARSAAAEQVISDLEDFAQQVEAAMRRAQSELAAFDAGPPDETDEARVQRWNAWAASWNERVATLRSELPPPPGLDADPAAGLAHAQLEAAIAAAPMLAQGAFAGDVPTAARRAEAVLTVEAALSEARVHLGQARAFASQQPSGPASGR